MAQGNVTARIVLVDEDGNEISADYPLQIDSEPLREAITSLTEAVLELRDLVVLITG